MKRKKLLERFEGCIPVLERSGVKVEKIGLMKDVIDKLDALGIAKKVGWLHRVEVACKHESEHYADLTPTAWLNLAMLSPGSEDIKKLKAYRAAVKTAFKS